MTRPKNYCIVLAAGAGNRMKFPTPKQFLKIAGRTVVEHTLDVLESHPDIDEIFIVIGGEYRAFMEEILLRNTYAKVTKILNGGSSRRESSASGISAVEEDDALVLLHDAVRPFLSHKIISDCLAALERYPAVDVAIPAVDTIIRVDDADRITDIPRRADLRRGQTPQGFRAGVLREAHRLAMQEPDVEVTDDCGLVLRYGLGEVMVVPGDERNIKITYPEDLYLADKIFQINTVTVDHARGCQPVEGKVIAVFGASRGIGEHIVRLGAERGATMAGFSRGSGVDVRSYDAVCEALAGVAERYGRIDAVVNTAAVLRSGALLTRSIGEIEQEVAVNYQGSINVIKAALPHLKPTRGSIALFTSSSYTRGRALYSIYSSTKAAVVNLVQGLADELCADGVRINAINPERTDTPMRRQNFGIEPAGTLLRPEAVAEATLTTLMASFSGMIVDVRRTGGGEGD
jgi:2-C-methyl-D-erythritol 4-phosphate cytidylyltransferase